MFRACVFLVVLALAAIVAPDSRATSAPTPASSAAAETRLAFTPRVLRAVKQEYLAIDRVPAARRKPAGYGTLGDRPLVVIRRDSTANPPNATDRAWSAAQQRLAGLSSRGTLEVAHGAGHLIPYEQPAIVAEAVRTVLAEIGGS